MARPKKTSVSRKIKYTLISGVILTIGLFAIVWGSQQKQENRSKASVSSQPPIAGGYFNLVPVGAWKSLPADADCAMQVHHSTWEPRMQNSTANQNVPTGISLRPWPYGSTTADYNTWMLPRVTGNFRGTTDEIVQWAACKWGWPDDVIRAEMIIESNWYQNLRDSTGRTISGSGFGDYTTVATNCPAGYTPTSAYILSGNVQYGCPRSFGVLQATWKDGNGSFGNYPAVQDSTAFDIDFTIGTLRACYEGMETWLKQSGPGVYAAGDMWGCIGRWYSGDWHSADAESYITKVKQSLNNKSWLTWPDQNINITQSPMITPTPTPTNIISPTPTIYISDTTTAVVRITSPLNGSTIGRSVGITATATDNVKVTKMEVYINGVLKTSNTNSNSISYGWNSKKAPLGMHTITVKAYDAAGNVGQESVTVYKQ